MNVDTGSGGGVIDVVSTWGMCESRSWVFDSSVVQSI